jgi:deazaflavin-dependent oxidoreductase (nitroreductase family)
MAATSTSGAGGTLAARLAAVAGRSNCRLTHFGRKSGKPYEVTVWFLVEGETVYLVTSDVKRQWTRNVLVRPAVRLAIGGERFEGEVSAVTDAAERAHVTALMGAKYWYVQPIVWLLPLLESIGWRRSDGSFRVRLRG